MAANSEKTTEYAFPSYIGKLGTGTTLAASTRHDFTPMHVYAETSARSFKSVILEVNFRDACTSAANIAGIRLGITCGSNAVSDADFAPTAIGNTGDGFSGTIIRDVTDYFNTNFGSGSANTVYPSFAMSTATNGSCQNITAKLIMTYEYTYLTLGNAYKTVKIPIQSASALLGLQAPEIGVGGTTSAPANQIPAFDTFLPEQSKSYKNIWFEIFANDGGAATTDFSASYTINDGGTAASRCLIEQALSTGVFYYDIWTTKYISSTDTPTEAYTISSSAASAFKVSSNLVNRFDTIGGLVCVTYSYNTATTTSCMNSLQLPISLADGYLGGTSASDASCVTKDIWVEEVTPTLAQSGVLLFSQCPAGATFNLLAGAQTARPYTLTALVNAGGHATMHRVDHNSGFTLAKGKNTLTLKGYSSTLGGITAVNGIFYLNYTSEVSTLGEHVHNRTTQWYVTSWAATGAAATITDILTPIQRTPTINAGNYFINDVSHEMHSWYAAATNSLSLNAEVLTGEYGAEGWQRLSRWVSINDGELSNYRQFTSCTDEYNQDRFHIGKMSPKQARAYRITQTSAGLYWIKEYLTYHNIAYTVSGSLSNVAGTGGGLVIDIFRTSDNYWSGSALTSASASYNTVVFDNAYPVYASVAQDSTHVGRSASATAGALVA